MIKKNSICSALRALQDKFKKNLSNGQKAANGQTHTYRPDVSETGTVFESWQIGQSCTNLRPPPWTTLGRASRLRWGVIV